VPTAAVFLNLKMIFLSARG